MKNADMNRVIVQATTDMANALAKHCEAHQVNDEDFFQIATSALTRTLVFLDRTTSMPFLKYMEKAWPELQSHERKRDEQSFPEFIARLKRAGKKGLSEEEAREWWQEHRAERALR
jgi:hypothetical protein